MSTEPGDFPSGCITVVTGGWLVSVDEDDIIDEPESGDPEDAEAVPEVRLRGVPGARIAWSASTDRIAWHEPDDVEDADGTVTVRLMTDAFTIGLRSVTLPAAAAVRAGVGGGRLDPGRARRLAGFLRDRLAVSIHTTASSVTPGFTVDPGRLRVSRGARDA